MKRTVVISGGGTGNGLAAAKMFAEGGDVPVLIGRRADVLQRAASEVPGAVHFAADLTETEGARQAAAFVGERFGRVDVLVHSAGGNGLLEPQSDTKDHVEAAAHNWTVNFRLNVLTAVLLTEALRERLSDGSGRLLFLSSIAASRGSGSGAYAASKAALHPYVVDLARELGPRGITVNAVAPGYTEGTEFFGEGGIPEERRRLRIGETLNQRAGTTDDVAQTLYWLASPAASHITAQVIQVSGGAVLGR